jgi:thiamine transporter
MYAPEGQSPYLYSLIFNGTSVIINIVYVGVVLGLLVKAAPKLFVPKA